MKKLLVGLSLLAAMLVVPAASATPPQRIPITAADFTDTTCAFPVDIHVTRSDETATFFSNGSIIVTGPVMATASANGKTVSMNVSGPTTISPDGTVIGHGLGIGPLRLPDGSVTLAYSTGLVDITSQPATPLHAHVLLDVCAALA